MSSEGRIPHRLSDMPPYGGDRFELAAWPLIGPDFPTYEIVWAWAIWPLTQRPYSQHLRVDLPPFWEDFAKRHYEVLLDLVDARKKIREMDEAVHGATDVYSALVAALNRARGLMKKMGVHYSVVVAGSLLAVAWREFEELDERLKVVRDPAHHSVHREKVKGPDGRLYVLRSDVGVYSRYRGIADITAAANSPVQFASDFREERVQVERDYAETLRVLEGIWSAAWSASREALLGRLAREVGPMPMPRAPGTPAGVPFVTSTSYIPLSAQIVASTTSYVTLAAPAYPKYLLDESGAG